MTFKLCRNLLEITLPQFHRLKKTKQEGPADPQAGEALAPDSHLPETQGSLLLLEWALAAELGPGVRPPPRPHGAGTSNQEPHKYAAQPAGRLCFVERPLHYSLLASGTPPQLGGLEEASWRALGTTPSTPV